MTEADAVSSLILGPLPRTSEAQSVLNTLQIRSDTTSALIDQTFLE